MVVNVFLFKYAKLVSGREVLVRTVLLPESTGVSTGIRQRQPTAEDLMAVARDRHTEELVEVCRTIKGPWGEEPRSTYGGSFRY